MLHLCKRLQAVLELTPRGEPVADIGCDHGRLACALLQRGAPWVTAVDISEPSLEKARRLAGFYKRHGWCETGIPYAIGGRETLLLHRGEAPQRADLRGVLEAVYAPMYGPKSFAKHVSLP